MIDNEKRAHDLTILYLQMMIKEGTLEITVGDTHQNVVDKYTENYKEILNRINLEF